MESNSNNNKALGTILNQQFVVQLGIFSAHPMIVENSLERGFLQAIWDFITMQFQLSSVFYTFSMGTHSHFFRRTILHGGATYRATELGTVVVRLQDHLMATGFWGKVDEIILDLRFFIFQYGIVYKLGIAAGSTSMAVYMLSWVYVFVVFEIYVVVAYTRDTYAAKEHIYYRSVQSLVVALAILVIIALMEFEFMDIFTSLVAFIPIGWGMILIAQVFRAILQHTIIWHGVVSLARMYGILFGIIVMAPVALLSWLPGFQDMQTRILFNEAFSRGLRISQLVTGKKS
ncbi:unnamed protein product [Lupinus luteus]|uniref:Glycosyl transferase 48 domain-containing protein n=1 Tax=Lupinus luteus TaxID=3873 RepID=A0AAV1XLF1_LUPLU